MKEQAATLARDLLAFIDASPTAWQATSELRRQLENAGYTALREEEQWNLIAGGHYFVERNGSALLAFACGSRPAFEGGFAIAGAHTDSPGLKARLRGASMEGRQGRIPVEIYGSPIRSGWLDRPLSLAGRVALLQNNRTEARLVDLHKPIALIPNLAVHLNREINKGFEYTAGQHLQALLPLPEKAEDPLLDILSKELDVAASEIVDFDLFFYDPTPGCLIGSNDEWIHASRLDNLAMCHTILSALLESTHLTLRTRVACFFDNEEIGSQTLQGARSDWLTTLLERIVLAQGGSHEMLHVAKARSFLISADMAHAQHPNFADKNDGRNTPVINGGPVVKTHGEFRYATDATSSAEFMRICNQAKVPVQRFAIKPDLPCGSTIGPSLSSALGMRSVDVGNPMWAMHSIRETSGTLDHLYMQKALAYFFSEV